MSPKFTAQWLRNAFDAHDRDEHERAVAYVERQLAKLPAEGCARGNACVCTKPEERAMCSYAPAPRGGL